MVSWNIFCFAFLLLNILDKIFFIIIDNKRMLLELKENIFRNRPYIFCRKLNIDNANSKKTDRLNKNCEIKTNANNTMFCGKYT